jgi:ABC-type lipoprotein release transport system permease subunit
MSAWQWLIHGLRRHQGARLSVVAGAVVAIATLTGAWAVGDSLRQSLRRAMFDRLGQISVAVEGGPRFFREKLAEELAEETGVPAAAGILLEGVVSTPDGVGRIAGAQICGVNDRFWELGGSRTPFPPDADAGDVVALNQTAAKRLGAKVGTSLVVRLTKPSVLPPEASPAIDTRANVSWRLTVVAVHDAAAFGRFGLRAEQNIPANVFIPLEALQKKLGRSGEANLLLLGGGDGGPTLEKAARSLQRVFQPADVGLEIRAISRLGETEIRSNRIFLEPSVEPAVMALTARPRGILTYFVNELRAGERATPYSAVAAVSGAPVPDDLRDDEIVVNEWLAEDLAVKPDDAVELTYFVVGPLRKLFEERAHFRVRAVIPLKHAAADRELLPPFPGLDDADDCRDWDAGFPIDMSRIRAQDEKYWDEHRGTPKAFISLKAGQALWAERFGRLTAVRHSASALSVEQAAGALRARLNPNECGLFFRGVRAEAAAAAAQADDFRALFSGLSFFVLAAALLLSGLLFRFFVESRAEEIGLLTAFGLPQKKIRNLFLAEAALMAAAAVVPGLPLGLWAAKLLLSFPAELWRDAAAATPTTSILAAGPAALAGAAAAFLASAASLRGLFRRSARELIQFGGNLEIQKTTKPRLRLWLGVGVATFAGSLALLLLTDPAGMNAAGVVFGAGALLLVAGLCFCAWGAGGVGARKISGAPTGRTYALRQTARRPHRSLAVAALTACGVFPVVAVGLHRTDPVLDLERSASGSGGFSDWAETTLPIIHDLSTRQGRRDAGLQALSEDAVILPLRVRNGDDAGCQNPNRAQVPRLLGAPTETLRLRNAFRFIRTTGRFSGQETWRLLEESAEADVVPAIGDQATLVWGLRRTVGEEIPLTDEYGRPFRLRIVGMLDRSLFHGSLLIADRHFQARFPSEIGCRAFLLELPRENRAENAATLNRRLGDAGWEMTGAAERLRAALEVENLYLSVFFALGTLGLALGLLGLIVLTLRNALERRSEIALLYAIGLNRRAAGRLWALEHFLPAGAGVVVGILAALPALLGSTGGESSLFAGLTLSAALLLEVWLCGWATATWALRGKPIAGLRDE